MHYFVTMQSYLYTSLMLFQSFFFFFLPCRQPDISESINPEVVAAEIANTAKMTAENKAKAENPMKTVTLHIHFKAILQGLTIGASLLPSLRAHHKVSFAKLFFLPSYFKLVFQLFYSVSFVQIQSCLSLALKLLRC